MQSMSKQSWESTGRAVSPKEREGSLKTQVQTRVSVRLLKKNRLSETETQNKQQQHLKDLLRKGQDGGRRSVNCQHQAVVASEMQRDSGRARKFKQSSRNPRTQENSFLVFFEHFPATDRSSVRWLQPMWQELDQPLGSS